METPSDWSKLPAQFEYLRPIAEDYDRLLRRLRYQDRQAMDSLSASQIEALAAVYEEIDSRGDARPISEWLRGIPGEEAKLLWNLLAGL